MKISFIIPNYNGEKLLEKNLPTVFAIAKKNNVEVIIIDDCSTDNSLLSLKQLQSSYKKDIEVIILENQVNSGFASTVNKGVKAAQGDIVVLLNTDVRPQDDFLQPLVAHFKKDNVFAVGCMDKSVENDSVVLRGRGLGKWQRGFLVHRRGEVTKEKTLWVSGGSSAFRKSLWEKLGGFNELYNPFYWEDIDLSYRALKAGYEILFEKESLVTHEHEKGSIKKSYSPLAIKTIAYRNQCFFVWLNASDPDLIVSHILWLPYHLVNTFFKKDFAFLSGLFQGILLFPQVIGARGRVQKLQVKTDKIVIRENGQ